MVHTLKYNTYISITDLQHLRQYTITHTNGLYTHRFHLSSASKCGVWILVYVQKKMVCMTHRKITVQGLRSGRWDTIVAHVMLMLARTVLQDKHIKCGAHIHVYNTHTECVIQYSDYIVHANEMGQMKSSVQCIKNRPFVQGLPP